MRRISFGRHHQRIDVRVARVRTRTARFSFGCIDRDRHESKNALGSGQLYSSTSRMLRHDHVQPTIRRDHIDRHPSRPRCSNAIVAGSASTGSTGSRSNFCLLRRLDSQTICWSTGNKVGPRRITLVHRNPTNHINGFCSLYYIRIKLS